jgi:hypothetical protein
MPTDPIRRKLACEAYAGFFRDAGQKLRQDLDFLERYKVETECGRLIIEAFELGYLPPDPKLEKLVAWHTGDGSRDGETAAHAVRVRCPANLFLDVAGGHMLRVRKTEEGVIQDEDEQRTGTARTGGLVPKDTPFVLRMTPSERSAFACEWLAKQIELANAHVDETSNQQRPKVDRGKLDEAAALEITKNPSLTAEQIALMLGTTSKTLRNTRRYPLFAKARRAIKARREVYREGDRWNDRSPDE